jgi:hypothetical protein
MTLGIYNSYYQTVVFVIILLHNKLFVKKCTAREKYLTRKRRHTEILNIDIALPL